MKLRTINRTSGLKLFMTSYTMDEVKPSDMSLREYAEWICTFTFFVANEHVAVMFKPHGDAYEFHISTTSGSSKKDVFDSYQAVFKMFKTKHLVTTISDKHPQVQSYCTKRFGFTKGTELEPVIYGDTQYKQYRFDYSAEA